MKEDRRSRIELPSRCRRVQVAVTTSNTTHHQAETPNRYKSISANQAPTLPPRLRISPAATLWDHPGSARLKVVRTRERYRAPATRTNSLDSRSSAATLPGRGAWFRFKEALIESNRSLRSAGQRSLIDAGILADEEPLPAAANAGISEHCGESTLRRPVTASPSRAPSRTGHSIDRQDGLVQENRTGAHLDVAARLEGLHHPADHLARGSDHLGDVLLGEFSCDHFLAVHGFRHFEQQARHSAVHVHQGEAADLLIGFSKPFDQSPHDRHGHLEVFGKASLEIALRETQHLEARFQ